MFWVYSVLAHISQIEESAKLLALRAKNVLMCQRALRAYALMCQRVFCAYVLMCQRALRPYVLTCQRALRPYVLTCQRASFDATIFSFAAIVAEVVHTVSKV